MLVTVAALPNDDPQPGPQPGPDPTPDPPTPVPPTPPPPPPQPNVTRLAKNKSMVLAEYLDLSFLVDDQPLVEEVVETQPSVTFSFGSAQFLNNAKFLVAGAAGLAGVAATLI